MHVRGKAMSMEAIYPDGRVEMLSHVDRFDFNWHVNYVYADDAAPVLPKGTIIKITAWHDNTAANPGESGSDAVGRLGPAQLRRHVSRTRQRDLSHRRGLRRDRRGAEARACGFVDAAAATAVVPAFRPARNVPHNAA